MPPLVQRARERLFPARRALFWVNARLSVAHVSAQLAFFNSKSRFRLSSATHAVHAAECIYVGVCIRGKVCVASVRADGGEAKRKRDVLRLLRASCGGAFN